MIPRYSRPEMAAIWSPDTVNGFHYMHEAYTATKKDYTGKVTVPTLWDKQTKKIVNN